MPKVNQWRAQAGMGTTERSRRQQKRGLQQQASEQWLYLLSDVDAHGKLSAGAAAELRDVENIRTSVGDASDDSGRLSKRTQSKFTAEVNDRSSIKRHSLQAAPLRGDSKGGGGCVRVSCASHARLMRVSCAFHAPPGREASPLPPTRRRGSPPLGVPMTAHRMRSLRAARRASHRWSSRTRWMLTWRRTRTSSAR